MNRLKYYITSLLILAIMIATFSAFADESADAKAKYFLAEYGWEVSDKCLESSQIIIPEPFDLVYENYNAMQLDAGLDLRPYMGKRGIRYTYEITNYPADVSEQVRANVIIIDGKCVGGDICTVSLDGFMHSLRKINSVYRRSDVFCLILRKTGGKIYAKNRLTYVKL